MIDVRLDSHPSDEYSITLVAGSYDDVENPRVFYGNTRYYDRGVYTDARSVVCVALKGVFIVLDRSDYERAGLQSALERRCVDIPALADHALSRLVERMSREIIEQFLAEIRSTHEHGRQEGARDARAAMRKAIGL